MNSDHRMEQLIGAVLRGGVLISAVIVMIGGIIFLGRHGSAPASLGEFAGEPRELRSLSPILSGALALRGRSIIALGLLALVATPIARVALTLAGFLRQRDWMFVAITAVVLATLLSTLGPLL